VIVQWIIAVSGLLGAVANTIVAVRHHREDDRRFDEVHKRITNGGPPPEVTSGD
jgi:hypothetical protein